MREADAIIIQRAKDVFKTFLTELEKRGHKVECKSWGVGEEHINKIDGLALEILLRPERNNSCGYNSPMWRNNLRIQVGDWTDSRWHRRKQFPEPKKGFDWKKIIDYIEEYMKQKRVRNDAATRAEINYKTATAAAERIKKTFKPKNIWLDAKEKSTTKPRIDISLEYLSAVDAERVVKMLVEELPDLFGEESE